MAAGFLTGSVITSHCDYKERSMWSHIALPVPLHIQHLDCKDNLSQGWKKEWRALLINQMPPPQARFNHFPPVYTVPLQSTT